MKEYKGQGQDGLIETLTPIMPKVYERLRAAMVSKKDEKKPEETKEEAKPAGEKKSGGK